MQGTKRKRVTQVGSGAYSVYLPKKWIDGWSPEQRAAREVDLHFINNSLLIVPALRRLRFETKVDTEQAFVRMMLLSAYVRGHHEVVLHPKGAFDEDCVAMARDLLRHLDERLLTTVGPEAIGFTVQGNMPPAFASGSDLLHLMTTKLREMVALAAECVEAFGTKPERALHTARLLHSLQDEDLSRLYHQAIRMVANLELPLGAVSDFQFLDLVAAEMQTVGSQCVAVGHAVISGYGLSPADLLLPRADLAKRAAAVRDLPPVVLAIVRVYGRSFEEARTLLARFAAALEARDATALLAIVASAEQAQNDLARRLFATIEELVGQGGSLSPAAYTAYQVRHAAGSVFAGLGRAAERAASLSAAQETVTA
ncbi:MAG: hypothetical protein ABR562_03765 [Thermoplasmatota archaeon]